MLDRTEEIACLLHRFNLLRVHGINEFGVCTCGDPHCQRQGKHPYEPRGYRAKPYASFDDFAGYNVGVACGGGLVVVDVDPRNGGDRTLREWEIKHGPMPPTWICETGGGGRHYYYWAHDVAVASARFPGIEIQSDGHYVIAPTSLHASGKEYTWADEGHPGDLPMAPIPQWLLQAIGERQLVGAPQTKASVDPCPVGEFRDAVAALERISPDVGYHEWIAIGMALHESGHGRAAYKAWDDWSRKGAKYTEGLTARKWPTFKHRVKGPDGRGAVSLDTIHRIADAQGVPLADLVDLSAFTEPDHRGQAMPAAESGLFDAFGLVGDIAEWIGRNAYRNHPAFALEAAFGVLAAVAQGRYDLHGISPNLYSVLVGPPSCGKNDYIRLPMQILETVDKNLIMGSDPASDRGLRNVLLQYPSRLWIKDELIEWMLKAFNPKSHESTIMGVYCTLWGAVDVLAGTSAKRKEDSMAEVQRPRFSILGTGTIHQWRELVHMRGVSQGGLLSRMVFVASDAKMAGNRRRGAQGAVPMDFSLRLRALLEAKVDTVPFCNPAAPNAPIPPIPMDIDSDAQQAMDEWKDDTDVLWDRADDEARHDQRFAGGIQQRNIDRGLRYSMLLALGDGRQTIGIKDVTFARTYMEHHSELMLATLAQFGQSSENERQLERISALIAKSPTGCLKTWLMQRTRSIDPRQRDLLIQALIDEGEIFRVKGDRGAERLVHKRFVKACIQAAQN